MGAKLTEAQRRTLEYVDKSGRISARHYEICPGIHFCPDWDSLPVCDASPEKEACTCRLALQESPDAQS